MKLNITSSLAIYSLFLSNLSVSAIDLNNLELNKNIYSFDSPIILADNKFQSNYLNKEKLKQYLNQYKQAKSCQIKGSPKQKKEKSFTKYLLECISYNFEVTNNSQTQIITALSVKSYPVLILQQKNRYKIKFSSEPRITAPRPIIVWTKNGTNEFADQFTQLKRATIVTDKFNKHFINNGEINIPSLSIGIVNGQSVVCAAPSGNCRSQNILWTLKTDNQKSNIISQLNDALKGNAASPLFESQDTSCVVKDENIKTQPNSVNMTLLVKKIITDEIQCPQNQESPEIIASELESSDNFEAIISDLPPMINPKPTIKPTKPNLEPIKPSNNVPNQEKIESCWEQWDCNPSFDDLDPELMDIDWDDF